MKLVLGLGNPGERYNHTRHNIGFEVVDELARRAGVRFRRKFWTRSAVAEVALDGQKVVLAKPGTFMNRSGAAAAALLKRYRLLAEDMLVVFDDADLPPGQLRIRARGSAGNHNGLKSLIGMLGSEDFARLRVGIGAKPPGADMAAYVLSPFGPEEKDLMKEAVQRSADALELLARHGIERAMNEVNRAG